MRCFRIPKDRLNHFLVFLNMNTDYTKTPEYIFDCSSHYEVVLYDLSKYQENKIEEMIEKYQ